MTREAFLQLWVGCRVFAQSLANPLDRVEGTVTDRRYEGSDLVVFVQWDDGETNEWRCDVSAERAAEEAAVEAALAASDAAAIESGFAAVAPAGDGAELPAPPAKTPPTDGPVPF